MKQLAGKKTVQDLLLIIIGSGLTALPVKCIYDPLDMVTGGFSGLSIIIKALTSWIVAGGIPLGVTSFVLNVPIFIAAYIKKGKEFVGKSFLAMVLLSVWLVIIPPIDMAENDFVIGTILGGCLMGLGIGLVLRANCTTGGTDMLAVLIHSKWKQFSVVRLIQIIDALIVVSGLYLFGWKSGLYAIFSIAVATKVSDITLEGLDVSRAVYILSDETQKISDVILSEMDRGVTGIQAKGMYTKQEKCMLLCVVSRKQIVWLKETVMEIDPKAFLIICDAREVWGEGFQSYLEKI